MRIAQILGLACWVVAAASARADNNVIISEFMAQNNNTLADDDGAYSDWIELFNAGTNTVDLGGWSLTDNASKMTKWVFPSTNMAPGQFMIVWASNKNRRNPGAPLHTNFKLGASPGGYLGLVRPDLSIATQFAPTYPSQAADISYGFPQTSTTNVVISGTTAARALVPVNSTIDGLWMDPAFDDSAWSNTTASLAFTNNVWIVRADSYADFSSGQGQKGWFYGYYNKTADTVTPGYQTNDFIPFPNSGPAWSTTNYWNGMAWDYYGSNAPYTYVAAKYEMPNGTNDGAEHWVIRRWAANTNGLLRVDWSLAKQNPGCGSGVTGYLFQNGVQKDAATIAYSDSVGVARTVLFTNVAVGDVFDFAVSPLGTDGQTGDLCDGAYGQMRVLTLAPATDIRAAMQTSNSTVYARIPFNVNDPSVFDDLMLRVHYADGFVAWLNGTKIAQRHAPSITYGGVVGSSTNDWSTSGEQGHNGWTYGYYNYTLDTNGAYAGIYRVDAFNPSDATWYFNGTAWVLDQNDPPYTMIGATTWRPNGTNNIANHWAVRRWESPVSGVVTARVSFAKSIVGGNGATLRIFVNGAAKFASTIGGSDTNGITSNVLLAGLEIGDLVDFALDPQGTDGQTDDTADLCTFGVVLTQLPSFDPSWNSAANAVSAPADEQSGETISLTAYTGFLMAGANVLAFQALNNSSADPEFLLLPELLGVTSTVNTNHGVYFLTPTPGKVNGVGTTNLGPLVLDVANVPFEPTTNQAIVVTARVGPTMNAIGGVTLVYRVMFSSEISVAMNDAGLDGDSVAGDGIYTATIPGGLALPGQMIRYYISAVDTLGNTMREPSYLSLRTPQYYGLVIPDPSLVTPLPVFHWFVQDFNSAATLAGTRGSIYYNGQFLDNVGITMHGQSSTGFPKHSYNFNLNPTYKLTVRPGVPPLSDFAVLSTYADRSFLRNMLAEDIYTQAGTPVNYSFAVRMQTNGGFFALQNLIEGGNSDFIQRIGYDPNGALYKIYNTLYSVAGNEKKTRKWEPPYDLQALINGVTQTDVDARTAYVYDNVNLPEVIDFLATKAINNDHDCCYKNHYLYRDSDGTGEWYAFPWDVDLTFGHVWTAGNGNYFDDTIYTNNPAPFIGANQSLFVAIYNDATLRALWGRRIRTLMDTILQPPGTPTNSDVIRGMIDAYAAQVRPDSVPDHAKWPGAAWFPPVYGPANPTSDFETELNRLKNFFLPGRRAFLFINQVTNIATLPQAQPAGANVLFGAIDYNPASSNQAQEYIELVNNNTYAVDISGWRLDGGVQFTFKGGTVIPASSHIYVSPDVKSFRARTTGPRGGQKLIVVGPYSGQLSARGEALALIKPSGQTNSVLTYTGAPSLAQQFLRITEIMYNPAGPTGTYSAQDFEFIELKNISSYATLDLRGVKFDNGIAFDFTGSAVTNLAPGQRVLVVKNAAAFAYRYGAGFNIAGTYSGSLNNTGERLSLLDAMNEQILDFSYNNTWYPLTDGLGFSLVTVNEMASPDTWGSASAWRASGQVNGTPGSADPGVSFFAPVLVNELLTRPILPDVDLVELYNPTATNADISGWFLTDTFTSPKKFRIPDGTIIPAGSYRVFTETDFNPGGLGFSFSSQGEEVYLFSADAVGNLTGYYYGFAFDAADEGVTFGRCVNSAGNEDFVAQTAPTLGTNNAGPVVGPIVINEIMYHPLTLTTNDPPASFLELRNIAATNVPLFNVAEPTNTWHLRSAVDFDFPTNVTLAPGGLLVVVGFDPASNATALAAFCSRYGVATNTPIYGPWQGSLPNSEGVIELKRPDLTTNNNVPYVLVERVHYHASPPWPCGADGAGASLQRQDSTAYGNEPNNWSAATPTPGTNNLIVAPTTPVITAPPVAQSVVRGATASFTVAACGSPQFYQWRFFGTNLPAATNGTLLLGNAQSSSVGNYAVVVWNSAGSVTSAPVSLSVLLPPVFTLQPQSQAVQLGSNATFQVAIGGDSPLSLQWFFNGILLSGATNATLSLTNLQPAQAGPYQAQASNPVGITFSDAAFLNVLIPASVATPPQSQTVFPYTNVSFTVTAAGSGPFTYQWRFNGTNLPGATNATLTKTSVLPADGGPYTALVSNSFSSALSAAATLTVRTNPIITSQPPNQPVMRGSNATFTVAAVSSSPLHYQWYFNTNTLLSGATNAVLVITNAQTVNAGYYTVGVRDDFGSVTSSPGQLLLDLPTYYTQQPQPSNTVVFVGSSVSFTVSVAGSPPFFYRWRYAPLGTVATNVMLYDMTNVFTLPSVVLTNATAYQAVVTNLANSTLLISSNAYLGVMEALTNQTTRPGSNVTFSFLAASFYPATANSNYVFLYRWWFNDTNLLASGTNASSFTNLSLALTNVQAAQEGTYRVVATNRLGSVFAQTATLTVLRPPTILLQPTNQTLAAGGTATFTTSADGRAPLRYQWYFGATALTGETSPVLMFANAQFANAGGYSVTIANPDGAVTSAVATLTVLLPPSIQQQPTNQNATPGTNVSFTVVAGGSAPLSYQWWFNETNLLAWATTPTLTVTNAQATNAGTYQVIVANQAGAAYSDAATLTINAPPTITQPPAPQSVECSSNAVFTVVAVGTPPLAYQWFHGTNAFPGATDSTLIVSNASSATAGNYSVLVTNSLGSNLAGPAALTLVDSHPPVILACAPPQSYPADANCHATLPDLTASVTATDTCGSVTITQHPSPGTVLGLGLTNVAFVATDGSGNSATCTVAVTVQDLTPPALLFYFTNLTLPAGTNCQALMPDLTGTNYIVALDACSSVTVTQSIATNTPLSLGTNLIVLVAFDAAGNAVFRTNAIVVADVTPPVLACTDLSVSADFGQSSRSHVNFSVTATDNCSNNGSTPNLFCIPPSGSTFPLGPNWVNCTATDASSNAALCRFQVVVTPVGALSATASETVNVRIPDGSPLGLASSLGIASPIERITNVTVTLNLSGGFNGDFHAYLVHDSGYAILLNRVGRTLANPYGYSDAGFDVTFDDAAPHGDIHDYRQTLFADPNAPLSGPLTNAWAPDGREAAPALVLDSTPRTATLSSFRGLDPEGRWTLFIADMDAVYSGTLVSWGLDIHGTNAPPTITTQPQSRTNVAGTTATFTVAATTLSTPSFQWYLGSTALPGATNAALTLPFVRATNAGDYHVVVTSRGGSVASDPATLTVQTLAITGELTLEEYAGLAHDGHGTRNVTFKATDSTGLRLALWTVPLDFVPGPGRSASACYTLTNVPPETVRLSAKTSWHLRQRLAASFTGSSAVVNFTGPDQLRGGDLNDSNVVDLDDYAQLAGAWYTTQPESDIDGSGLVDIMDYFLLASHWLQSGDPE